MTLMSYEVALLVFGILLLLVGLVGKVKAKELEIGTSSGIVRVVLSILGIVLVVLSFNPDIARSFFSSQETQKKQDIDSADMGKQTKLDESTATSSAAKLLAPIMESPECNSARTWPPDNYVFAVYWHPVEGAASYGIEMDCRSGKDDPTAWRGSEEHPWFVKRGVVFRMMNNPIYSSKIHLKAKDVGCDALRWRVWAIDHDGNDGEKSQWCQISFF